MMDPRFWKKLPCKGGRDREGGETERAKYTEALSRTTVHHYNCVHTLQTKARCSLLKMVSYQSCLVSKIIINLERDTFSTRTHWVQGYNNDYHSIIVTRKV